MTKQKKGFLVFLCSLIPGAGELYMGFFQKGLSIMILFWSIFALCSATGMGWSLMFLPILWFYSFFDVHNLKSLSEEEFYSMQDAPILYMNTFITDKRSFLKKYRYVVAVFFIIFGICLLWQSFSGILLNLLPPAIAAILKRITYYLPQAFFSVLLIGAGICLILGKRKELNEDEDA